MILMMMNIKWLPLALRFGDSKKLIDTQKKFYKLLVHGTAKASLIET